MMAVGCSLYLIHRLVSWQFSIAV